MAESWNTGLVTTRRDDLTRPTGERRSSATARDRALRTRADRRHQEQPLSSLGVRVDEALADDIESLVRHRRPAAARKPERPSLGRGTVARNRRRVELREITNRHGRGRLDLREFEDADASDR
jgi:hypothetical protein